MEESGVLQSDQEISLIDILWRQDIDLGVEREAFDVHFQEREEDARRERRQEEERRKKESELERVMLALRKMDKETGEILPQTFQGDDSAGFDPCIELMAETFLSGQGSPITQNPLLSALLLSEKPPAEKEKASIDLLALPELQNYLDALEAHVPESLHDLQGKTTDSYINQMHELPMENTGIDTVSSPHVLAHTHSGCAEIMDTPEYTAPPSAEAAQPLPQILPEAPEIDQPFLDTEDFTESFLDTIMSTSPTENLNQTSFELNSDLHTQEELYPELDNTIAPHHSLCQGESVHKDSSDATFDMTLFSLESFTEPVDLDPSLYADDPFINIQPEAEEAGYGQSDHTELFDLSLLSEVVDLQPPLLGASETSSQHLSQSETLLEGPSEADATTESLCETTATTQPPHGHRSWSVCRDGERARTLSLPLSVKDIITMSVDAFNEAISNYELNEGQLSLMKDIRRRGKNKMAAQSCRKRKLDSLVDLEAEVEELREEREHRILEKESNVRGLRETRVKLSKLYGEVFSQLRDEHGNPYSTKEYTLQYSTDGRFFILPRSPHASKHT